MIYQMYHWYMIRIRSCCVEVDSAIGFWVTYVCMIAIEYLVNTRAGPISRGENEGILYRELKVAPKIRRFAPKAILYLGS